MAFDLESTAGSSADHDRPADVRTDVDQINNKIDIIASQDQKARQKTAAIPIWRYAAAAILVLLMGFAGYFLTVHLNQQPPGVLSEKQSEEDTPEGPIASDDQDKKSNDDDQQAQLEPLTDNADTEEKQANQQQQETTSEQPAPQPKGNDQAAATSDGRQGDDNDNRADQTQDAKRKAEQSAGSEKGLTDQEAGQKQETGSQRTQQDAAQAYQAEPEAREASKLLPKAMEQFQQENYNAALATLTSVIANQPENLKARYYAGLSAFELERYETALDHFNYLVGPEPRHTYFEDALWQLGQTHLRNGDTTKAKNVYKRIVANQYKHAKKAGKKLKNLGD